MLYLRKIYNYLKWPKMKKPKKLKEKIKLMTLKSFKVKINFQVINIFKFVLTKKIQVRAKMTAS